MADINVKAAEAHPIQQTQGVYPGAEALANNSCGRRPDTEVRGHSGNDGKAQPVTQGCCIEVPRKLVPNHDRKASQSKLGHRELPGRYSCALQRAQEIEGQISDAPTSYLDADTSPIDYQAAAQLLLELEGSMTCVGETVYSYGPGFWQPYSTYALKKRVQATLRRFRAPGAKGAFIFGSNAQVQSTIESFKTLLGQGDLLSAMQEPRVIVFSNGTFDLQTGRLGSHNPDHGATYGLELPFVEGANCPPELEVVISRCYPPGAEVIIRAMIRWAVDPTIRYGQCFHLLGPSGSGKGLLIDFLRSLFPAQLNGDLHCPSDLSSPEKVHQYVLGRRLVVFPDCRTSFKGKKHWNSFYELVENKLVTTRKLYCGEAERSRRMNCRFVLASTEPFRSTDGMDGFQRRVLTLCTLPREGDQDHSLVEALLPDSERAMQIRGEAVSWALAMPMAEVLAVLNGRDSEGLLRDAAEEVAVSSDSISLWIDACLEPADGPDGPDTVVSDLDWQAMFEVFKAWCKLTCSSVMPYPNFKDQVRQVLGPKRCLPRAKAPMMKSPSGEASRRPNLPRVDAGFQLRRGLCRTSDTLSRYQLGSGGLAALAALPGAKRLA